MSKEERRLKRQRRIEEMENYGLDVGFYQREMRQRHGEDVRRPDEGVRHSGSYHRFFEGYSEQTVIDENGRSRIARIYVGDYYQRKCTGRVWIAVKAAYALLYLAAVAAYLYAVILPVGSNRAWYVAAPGLLSVVPLILLLGKLAGCVTTRRRMMIYDYKHVFQRVIRYCVIAACFLGGTALTKVLFLILERSAQLGQELLSCLGCLLAAALILVIGLLERGAEYECVPNSNAPPKDGVVL